MKHQDRIRRKLREAPPVRAKTPLLVTNLCVSIPVEIERQLLAALACSPHAGETIDAACERAENEVVAILARLSPLESRALQRRLVAAGGDDQLATQFAHLVEPRHARLRSFFLDSASRDARANHAPTPGERERASQS